MARQLIALLTILLVVAACSPGSEIAGSDIEQRLIIDLVPSVPGAIEAAECPERITVDADVATTCRVTIDGAVVDVLIEQGGEAGSLEFSLAEELLVVADIEAMLAEQFTAEVGQETVVRCGDARLRVRSEVEDFDCIATDPRGTERILAVTIAQDNSLTFELR